MELVGRINGLHAEPWIGQHFQEAAFRPFFVGHSHYEERYGGEPAAHDVTHAVIGMHMREEAGLRFLTSLMQMATGLPHAHVEREAFYARIAFANLLQTYLETPRMKADPNHLAADTAALTAVFEVVEPTHVIIFGEQVWEAFVASHNLIPDRRDGKPYWAGHIRGWPVFWSQHPSSRFSGLSWAVMFGRFLRENGMSESAINGWVDEIRCRPESNLLNKE